MLHNKDEYPDPFAFKPERFLKDGKLNPNIRDPALMAFGFGRRWQMNSHYFRGYETDQSKNVDYALVIILPFRLFGWLQLAFWPPSIFLKLWIRMVEWLSLILNIRRASFGEFKPQSVKMQSDEWRNSHPFPFGCSIKPRSPIAEELIRAAVDSFWPTYFANERSLFTKCFSRYSTARNSMYLCLRLSSWLHTICFTRDINVHSISLSKSQSGHPRPNAREWIFGFVLAWCGECRKLYLFLADDNVCMYVKRKDPKCNDMDMTCQGVLNYIRATRVARHQLTPEDTGGSNFVKKNKFLSSETEIPMPFYGMTPSYWSPVTKCQPAHARILKSRRPEFDLFTAPASLKTPPRHLTADVTSGDKHWQRTERRDMQISLYKFSAIHESYYV